jgi:hypothetical protein
VSRSELHTYRYACDGVIKRGKCDSTLTFTTTSEADADSQAREWGWHEDDRGWICKLPQHGVERP